MLLDNLFPLLGETGTALTLIGIAALLGVPAAATVFVPNGAYCRLSRSR
jgi:hypothetical protein